MSAVAKPSKSSTTRTLHYHRINAVLGSLNLKVTRGKKVQENDYYVEREGEHVFRLTKYRTQQVAGQENEYVVTLGPTPACNCQGHQRHQRCKHADALAILRRQGRV